MSGESTNDWFRLFNLAREHSARELEISNDLLNTIDEINALARQYQISEEQAIKITTALMEVAIKLAQQSKEMTSSIYTLVGKQ